MNYTPVEKMSKKAQKELNAKRRGSWNGVKPVTRIHDSGKRTKIESQRKKEMEAYL